MKNPLNLLNVTELDYENDTVASAFIKGATNSYVKIVVIGSLIHLGIKGVQHFTKKKDSGNGEA